MDTHKELIRICLEIGCIAGCNGTFTSGLARRVEATGKTVEALTIAELLALSRDHNTFYNRIYSDK